jgi:hypothetical protein
MKELAEKFGKNGSSWRWLQESLYLSALALSLAAALLQ